MATMIFSNLLTISVVFVFNSDVTTQSIQSNSKLNTKHLILKNGYPFENHTVLTADGYILEIHRIPYGIDSSKYTSRPPVLLVPGIMCSAAIWLNSGPKSSLGFILADRGYDVWLANFRGTIWSRKHITLNPDRDRLRFWNFSFHEIGYYDLPAFIDYILNVTKQEQLFYVGHSQGTTSFFVLGSERPEYNKKVRLSIALAPVAHFNGTSSTVIFLTAALWNEIEAFIHRYQFYEVPNFSLLETISEIFCNDLSPLQNMCVALWYIIGGYSDNELNKTLIPTIIGGIPAGGSIKQVQHYTQLFLTKSFHNYDYGEKLNLEIYGKSTPPNYNLTKVTTPHLFYYGSNDIFSTKENIARTTSELPNVKANKLLDGFNHLDFLWGINVVEKLYNEIIELMTRF